MFVGQPDDPTWKDAIKGAIAAMKDALEKLKFPCGNCGDKAHDKKCKDCKKARGDYQSISVGLSLGSGSVVCLLRFITDDRSHTISGTRYAETGAV